MGDDAHRARFDNIEKAILGVEEALHLNHTHFENKHDALGLDADSRHKEINEAIDKRFDAWETKFSNIEHRVEAHRFGLDALGGELAKAMSEVDRKFLDAFELLKRTSLEAQEIHQQSTSALKEEFSNHYGKSTEIHGQKLAEHITEVDAKHDELKNEIISEFTKHYQAAHSQLGREITERFEMSVNNSSVEINKIIIGVKKENDAALHDMQSRIDELRTTLVQERNDYTKWMDEERAAFRKAHYEHVHIVEVERDSRLRQMQELRVDFLRTMKERDNDHKPRLQFASLRSIGTLGDASSTMGVRVDSLSPARLSPLRNDFKAAKSQ